jgi:hypothetical protein
MSEAAKPAAGASSPPDAAASREDSVAAPDVPSDNQRATTGTSAADTPSEPHQDGSPQEDLVGAMPKTAVVEEKKPQTRRRALEISIFFIISVVAFLGGAALFAGASAPSPAKLPEGSFEVGLPSLVGAGPDSVTIDEFHGVQPEGYSDVAQVSNAPLVSNSDTHNPAVTLDIRATYLKTEETETPIKITVSKRKGAKLYQCNAVADNLMGTAAPAAVLSPTCQIRNLSTITDGNCNAVPPAQDPGRDLSSAQLPDRIEFCGKLPVRLGGITLRVTLDDDEGEGFAASGAHVEATFPSVVPQTLTSSGTAVAWASAGSEISTPGGGSTQWKPYVVVNYWIPGADQLTWSGDKPGESRPPFATWFDTAANRPSRASAVWDDKITSNNNLLALAGIALGAAGAALIAAVQAIFK